MKLSRVRLVKIVSKDTPSVDYQFDSGGFQSTSFIDSKPTVRINPYLDIIYGGNKTQWYAVRLKNFGGLTPTLLIDNTTFWTSYAAVWHAAWATSLDTDIWNKFDNDSIVGNDITLSNNTPFTSNIIYVGLNPLYPFSRTQRLISSWSLDSLVGETASSTNKIIGYTPAVAVDGMGKQPASLPYYAFKVANATANSKSNGILSTGQHGCEPLARFAFEGAITWLLTTSVEQKALLDWFTFYCYPDLYPLNVWAGHSRDFWEDYTTDVNKWDATPGTYESRDTYETAFRADTGSKVAIDFDYHSYVSGSIYGMGDTENAAFFPMTAYKTEMVKLDSGWTLFEESLPHCLPHWCQANLGSVLPMTIEQRLGTGRGVTDWKTHGQNTLTALSAMVAKGNFTYGPLMGSRTFNGTTDKIDWTTIYNPASTATTISGWFMFTGVINTTQYLVNICDTNVLGLTLMMAGSGITGSVELLGTGTSGSYMARITTANAIRAGVGIWNHILATYDGTFGDPALHYKLYVNGVECTYSDAGKLTGTAPELAHNGTWTVGGRDSDNLREFCGQAAQVGVWNRVLTSTEITSLAAGSSPNSIQSSLKFHFKGDTSDLHDQVTNTLGTATGTVSNTGLTNGPDVGSRLCTGGTNKITFANIYSVPASTPFSISLWFYPTTTNQNAALFGPANAAGTHGCYLWIPTAGRSFALTIEGTTGMYRTAANSSWALNTWQLLTATYNGGTSYTGIHLYVNGIETSYQSQQNGSGLYFPFDGSFYLDGFWNGAGAFVGNMAQVAMWNSVIDATTIAGLAKGYAPNTYLTNLQFYFKGHTSDLHDVITNSLGVATGTTQVNGVGAGPTIYYP